MIVHVTLARMDGRISNCCGAELVEGESVPLGSGSDCMAKCSTCLCYVEGFTRGRMAALKEVAEG
jgi:hypothetical protein